MTRWTYAGGLLLVIIFLLALVSATSGAVATDSDSLDIEYISSEQVLSLADVYQNEELSWQQLKGDRGSFGYTSEQYWLRLPLAKSAQDRVLNVGYPLLDNLNVYWVHEDTIDRYQLGDNQPYYQRPILTSEFAIPIPKGETGWVYLSAKTGSSMRLPITIDSQERFFDVQMQKRLAEGIYFGVLLCMAVYNLFGFVASREPEFGLYSLYTLFFGGFMLSLDGLGFRYLWPDALFLQDRGIIIFGSLTFFTAACFAYQLLRLKDAHSSLGRGLFVMAGLSALVLFVGLFTSYRVSIHLLLALAAPGCLYLLTIGILLWRKGLVYARMFTIAWGALLLSVIANSLGYLGLIDSMFIQRHAIMLGSGIEILLLSWVLAVRYNEQRRERLEAQERHNAELEDSVAERTFELQIALRELQDANSELEAKNFEDSLTGLHNRRYFSQQLEREYRRSYRTQQPMTLLMIDIDHFKAVNDSHGHLIGDQILVGLADTLQATAKRPADVVCRYGGEEFAIILGNTDSAAAALLAKRILATVREQRFVTDAGLQTITLSVGIAELNTDTGQTTEDLFKVADDALYRAKRGGRDQVVTGRTEE